MTDEQGKEPDEQTALVLRVQEWAAWLPTFQDPMASALQGVSGETGIEIEKGERLADIEVLATQQTRRLPIPANGDDPAGYQAVKLVVFRATLARVVTGPLPEMPDASEIKSKLVMPPGHQNRKQRREKK